MRITRTSDEEVFSKIMTGCHDFGICRFCPRVARFTPFYNLAVWLDGFWLQFAAVLAPDMRDSVPCMERGLGVCSGTCCGRYK
jgi:hypothetical protein